MRYISCRPGYQPIWIYFIYWNLEMEGKHINVTFTGSILHQQNIDRFVQWLQLSGRFWGWRVVIKAVPAPIPPSSSSSSFPALVLVLHAVAVPGATPSAVIPLTVATCVQGSSPATFPPGSIRAGWRSLLAPSTAPYPLVVVSSTSVFGVQVPFNVRRVFPAFSTVPAIVIVGIVIVGGRSVFPTVCTWGGWLLM